MILKQNFLKYSKVIISPLICNIFNSCIEQGKFPDSLKIAQVVPIFKEGDLNQAVITGQFPNYRSLAKFLKSWFATVFTTTLKNIIFV